MNLFKQTQNFISQNKLISKSQRILVGVSGGPDSIALLHTLYQLRHELGFEIIVAHFNHKLRKESDSDESFVKKVAENLNLTCHCDDWTNPKTKGFEEAARKARHQFFTKTLKKTKAHAIALAHTLDDQAETVLMRILRGSGLQGLSAIKAKNTIDELLIIRPFLKTTKNDILNHLEKSKLKYRKDSSNQNTDIYRNRIRLKLIPELLKNFNPNTPETLANLADLCSEDYDYLKIQTNRQFKRVLTSKSETVIRLDLKGLKGQHPALMRMLIRKSIEEVKGSARSLTQKHIAETIDLIENRPSKSIVHLPGKLKAQVSKTHLTILNL